MVMVMIGLEGRSVVAQECGEGGMERSESCCCVEGEEQRQTEECERWQRPETGDFAQPLLLFSPPLLPSPPFTFTQRGRAVSDCVSHGAP